MVIRTLSLAVSLLVLAGCAVGPDYKATPPAPVTLQSAQDPAFTAESPVGQWWSQFDDPVLESLVRDSLVANHDLRIAIARVKEARSVFVERRLDQAPHVTAGGDYDRRKQPDLASADSERVLTESYSLGFDAR
ncbi:MAG TPA: TolC family protein, partial [Stenotrophomonas sp.]